jgi:hypothetical protein
MWPTRARILPASRFRIRCSWVTVLALAWTAVVISLAVVVMRRSIRRISAIRSLARARRVRDRRPRAHYHRLFG